MQKLEFVIFHDINTDPVFNAAACGTVDGDALSRVIEFSETEGVCENAFAEYVASRLIASDNILARLTQSGKKVGDSLREAALADIEKIMDTVLSASVVYTPSGNPTGFYSGYTASIKSIVTAKTADELLERLTNHYRTLGAGQYSRYIAYKYDGRLEGIASPDVVTFDSLIGLEYQKEVLIDNTRAFVNGRPANNVLLFGDRGTGKSSSVKALLQMFKDEGLRLVELPKQYVGDMPRLSEELSQRPGRYILFLDDLSFETRDSEYRTLKIAMEGQLQASPENVLVYATSNRRHLIKESWADREGTEVHRNDNMQELLSLSERFGISLVFSAPNQREYLNIVRGLLEAKGVEMNGDIERQAVVWQMNYGGRNARCAKQFTASYLAKNH